jgi:hypothetical protein
MKAFNSFRINIILQLIRFIGVTVIFNNHRIQIMVQYQILLSHCN